MSFKGAHQRETDDRNISAFMNVEYCNNKKISTYVPSLTSVSTSGGQAMQQDPSPSSSCPPPPVPSSGAPAADVMVNFDPDPADLALSSVPGQEAFDPRRHRFSEEELKPQPMIKKARKMLVPDEQKVAICGLPVCIRWAPKV